MSINRWVHQPAAILTLALVSSLAIGIHRSSAAVVAFSDFDSFNTAALSAGGTSELINFDSLTAGSELTNVGDVDFFIDDGELRVLDTFPETLSGPNYIGDDGGFNFSEQFDEGQTISITFGSARSAVGLWVQYDPVIGTNDGIAGLFDLDSAVTAEADGLGVALDPGGATDRAFFVGLVQTDGSNSINEVELGVFGLGELNYTFDNVVSYQVTAIPEPSALAMLTAVAGGIWFRRRRRSAV